MCPRAARRSVAEESHAPLGAVESLFRLRGEQLLLRLDAGLGLAALARGRLRGAGGGLRLRLARRRRALRVGDQPQVVESAALDRDAVPHAEADLVAHEADRARAADQDRVLERLVVRG